jgi:hypothetical protein
VSIPFHWDAETEANLTKDVSAVFSLEDHKALSRFFSTVFTSHVTLNSEGARCEGNVTDRYTMPSDIISQSPNRPFALRA